MPAKTNRLRTKGEFAPGVILWDDYLPSGALQGHRGPFAVPAISGFNASMADYVEKPQKFRRFERARKSKSKYASKILTRTKQRFPNHDLIFWKDTVTCSDDDVWYGLANRQPTPSWGAVNIKGPISASMVDGFHPLSWVPWPAGMLPSALDSMVIRAIGKAKSSDIMLGEIIGTLGQTIRMLANPFSQSQKLLESMLKRGANGISRGLSPAAAMSAAWLEVRYGWIPLINDLATVISKIDDARKKMETVTLVKRASESFKYEGTRILADALMANYGPAFKRSCVYLVEGTVRGGVTYKLHFSGDDTYMSKLLGLRLRDIPGIVWELIPWSFVVDWFIKVGDWIEAIMPDPSITILDTWNSLKITYKYRLIIEPNLNGFPSDVQATFTRPPEYLLVREEKSRAVNPELSWIPTIDWLGLSDLQLLDSLALAVAFVTKSVPKMVSR